MKKIIFTFVAIFCLELSDFCFSNYLDYQASTQCDPLVIEEMRPYLFDNPANPHGTGIQHKKALSAIERARRQIADLINASPAEIIFTSGATESNNLAIQGIASAYADKGRHIITCVTEHKSVLEPIRHLENQGFVVTYLPVKPNGILEIKEFIKAIRPDTVLVSIMAVNNEIGVIQPIEQIGRICRQRGIIFHCDASQATGKIPINIKNIDALSISGHKMYAPKGIGALYLRKGIKINPLFFGGGQQSGIRPGTLPVALCVALGKACDICKKSMYKESEKITYLQKRLLKSMKKLIPDASINGDIDKRIPGNISVNFKNIDTTEIIKQMPKFTLSLASSCYGQEQPSHVLQAISKGSLKNTLRIGIGRFTQKTEIDRFILELTSVIKRLKKDKSLIQKNYDFLSNLTK